MAPIPKVTVLGNCCDGPADPCTACFKAEYDVNLTAEFAPCRIICGKVQFSSADAV
jgi:hypothetical protein